MPMEEWKDEYKIDVKNIDEQHQKLFNLLGEVESCDGGDECYKKLGAALKTLAEYTQYHFAEEEKLMEEINFAEYKYHKQLHKNLVNEVVAILLRLKKGKEFNREDMIDFLRHWLVDHIEKEDLNIGKAIELKKKLEAAR